MDRDIESQAMYGAAKRVLLVWVIASALAFGVLSFIGV